MFVPYGRRRCDSSSLSLPASTPSPGERCTESVIAVGMPFAGFVVGPDARARATRRLGRAPNRSCVILGRRSASPGTGYVHRGRPGRSSPNAPNRWRRRPAVKASARYGETTLTGLPVPPRAARRRRSARDRLRARPGLAEPFELAHEVVEDVGAAGAQGRGDREAPDRRLIHAQGGYACCVGR